MDVPCRELDGIPSRRKATYEAPELVEYGALHRITQGTGCSQGDQGGAMAMTPPGTMCPGMTMI